MEDEAFLRVLLPYMEAFVERNAVQRLRLLEQALSPTAEIRGPKRVFIGYAEIAEKIIGFQVTWPNCRLVLASGLITFQRTCHFATAIVGPEDQVRASGHSVVELASDGRILRVLAFWGPAPSLPDTWPQSFQAAPGASTPSAA